MLSDQARRAIVERSAEVSAWVLADEVHQGAKLDGGTTPSLWGSYERVIVVNGLSKAYGLPGLRIGWLVAPAPFTAEAWARHDYATIGPAGTSDQLAAVALEPPTSACRAMCASATAPCRAGSRTLWRRRGGVSGASSPTDLRRATRRDPL